MNQYLPYLIDKMNNKRLTPVSNRILIIVPRAFLPQLTGGLEISAFGIAKAYAEMGFEVHLAAKYFTNHVSKASLSLKRKMLGPYNIQQNLHDLTIHKDIWHPQCLLALIDNVNPNVILFFTSGSDETIGKVIQANRPSVFFICGAQMNQQLPQATSMNRCEFVGESSFITDKIKTTIGRTARKIQPIIDLFPEHGVKTSSKCILVVNPHPKKGGEKVLDIIKHMHDRKFLIVGGWQHETSSTEIEHIERELKRKKNVRRLGNIDNMAPIFAQSACLLMPCIVQEAYGRTVAEAHKFGLPVLASTRGALSETVGKGGVTIAHDSSTEKWVGILNKLFDDSAYYSSLSNKALEEAKQPERDNNHIKTQLKDLVEDLIVGTTV